jgi:hypothetical protein
VGRVSVLSMTRAEQNAVARVRNAVPSASEAVAGAFVAAVGADCVFDMSFDLIRAALAVAVSRGVVYSMV